MEEDCGSSKYVSRYLSDYGSEDTHTSVTICAWKSISSSWPSLSNSDFFEYGRCSFQFTRWESILSIMGSSRKVICCSFSTRPRFRTAALRYAYEEKLISSPVKALSSKSSMK